jgi:hypothetical protein
MSVPSVRLRTFRQVGFAKARLIQVALQELNFLDPDIAEII